MLGAVGCVAGEDVDFVHLGAAVLDGVAGDGLDAGVFDGGGDGRPGGLLLVFEAVLLNEDGEDGGGARMGMMKRRRKNFQSRRDLE